MAPLVWDVSSDRTIAVTSWVALLDDLSEWSESNSNLLSPVERDRADRYAFVDDSRRFVTSRLVLRTLLGGTLGCHPQEVQFDDWCEACSCPHAKPRVVDAPAQFDFSLSRSGGVVLIALADAGPIGVDIERLDCRVDVEPAAVEVLTEAEWAQLPAEPSARASTFVRWWSRKEAYAKWTGLGMRIPMREVVFEPIGGTWIAQGLGDCEAAVVRDLDVAPGYAAALAVPASVAKPLVLAHRSFTPPGWGRLGSGLP